MTINLPASEKIVIVEQHLKNLLYAEYNLSLSIMEANAATVKNQTTIDNLNIQASEIAAQKAVLQEELDKLLTEPTYDIDPQPTQK
jgi:hypothetical protein